jgi:hypothetical protein
MHFLNGKLEEDVYMVHRRRYKNKEHKGNVCKLKKAIYGLKKAQTVWDERIDNVFLHFGSQKC